MKLKGINPLEQHVEKIVLGVVGLALLGVIAMQVLLSPNSIDVGGGESVPPDRVFAKLGTEADRVLGAMTDDSEPDIAIETPDLLARFDEAISRDSGAADGPRIALGRATSIEIGDVAAGSGPVMTLRVPAPGAPVVSGQWGTLDPYFVDRYPAVTAYTLRNEQPYDLPTVSIESLFDGTQLRAALEASEEGRRAIPAGWWASGMAVLRVEVERSTRLPGGAWSAPEPIGEQFWADQVRAAQSDFRGGFQAAQDEPIDWENIEPATLASLVSNARMAPEVVARSPFVPTIAGPQWYPPSEADERAADEARRREIADIDEEIADLNESIARIEQQRQERTNQRQTTTNRPRQSGGGTNPGSRPTRPTTNDPQRPDRDPFTTRIESLQEDITELEERRAELAEPDQQRVTGSRGLREEITPLLEDETFSLIMHDIAVQPGTEYRYRARVAVNNPLFGRQRSIGDSEPDLVEAAAQPLVFSDWSEWSEPAPVDRPFYYFVKSGAEAGELGKRTSSAAVEVFQLYYGYYRNASDNIEPGQPVNASFRLPEELLLFDLEEIDPAQLALYFERIGTANPDQVRRGRPQVIDPLRQDPLRMPSRPVIDPRIGTPGSQPIDPGMDPADPAELEEEELPEGVTEIEGRLSIPIDAVLLDVARMPDTTAAGGLTGGKDWYEAYFYDALDGIDVMSTVRTEAERALFDRLAASARDGENAKIRPLTPNGP